VYLLACGVVHNDFKNAFNKIKVVGFGFVVVTGAVTSRKDLRVMHFKVGI
jgi:hypothetical protein